MGPLGPSGLANAGYQPCPSSSAAEGSLGFRNSVQHKNSALHGKRVKVGRFGNAMVPANDALVQGLPSRLQETCPSRTTKKAARESANAACIGGLRSPWRAAESLHLSGAVGAKVRAALKQALGEHPALLPAADGDKAFEPDAEEQRAGVERARVLVAEALGVTHPQPLGLSTS